MYFLFYTKYCSFLLCEPRLAKLWCSCICCLLPRPERMQLGSPIPGNSDHWVSEADLSQYKQQTKLRLSWAYAQENQPHMNSHHGGRRKGKEFQKQTQERKRQAEKLAPHWLAPTWMCERQSLRKIKLPSTCPGEEPPSPDLAGKQWQRLRGLTLLR